MLIISKAKDAKIVIGLLMLRRFYQDIANLGVDMMERIESIDVCIARYRSEVLRGRELVN